MTYQVGTQVREKSVSIPADAISGDLPASDEMKRAEVRRYIDIDPDAIVIVTISEPYDSEGSAFLVG
ncbi:MAG TPA: hypothetical protein VF665_06485 [Longimicrobium sp.]|uniref:hypothetical protein n=1 Tax=Longimicrobium sp. TaxID=2029185 RepID=UPI002EDB845C